MSVEAGNDEEPGMSDSAISPSSADTVEGTEAEASQSSELKKEAHDLVAKCYNNLAQCILNGPPRQKEDYMRAVYYCDSVFLWIDANGY
jgi:hypothetical protein